LAINARDDLTVGLPCTADDGVRAVEWRTSTGLVPYPVALEVMDARAAAIAATRAEELVWLLEHPPVYTAGTSARDEHLLDARFPVFRSGRGGQFTYHGPGQRVVYTMLDLRRRTPDVRRLVASLEEWIIRTLADFGIHGERREDRVGVWVRRSGAAAGEDKIAALGVRIRHFVTLHGISINLDPDLSHFGGIVPCGVEPTRFGVTSFAALGRRTTMAELDAALRGQFESLFGSTRCEPGDPPEWRASAAVSRVGA
jgi:lipoyl(octanoyl) transferase